MADLDLLHFEQLKAEVQAEYLKNHHPSYDEISKWKGIDIIYFQEDLRKKAKGNISEKSFYTYFKTSPSSKLPRIDMLNLLAIYAGYQSWYDFKKNHLFANEFISRRGMSLRNEDDDGRNEWEKRGGLVYDEAAGWPEEGIAPGTRWADVPADWRCPECGVGKSDFVLATF